VWVPPLCTSVPLALLPTTLVGSYVQPDWLIDREKLGKRFPPRVRARELWRVTPEWLEQAQDDATTLAIRDQELAGLDIITDGEMRRTHFIAPLTDVISGIKPIPAFTRVWRRPHDEDKPGEATNIQVQYAVVEKIRRTRSLTSEEFAYARSRAKKPLKVTLPSPLMMALRWSRQYSRDAYPDPFELFRDAAAIVRQDVQELTALGCEYVQLDAPELGMLCDPVRRK